jgi:hypothetical protein
MRGESCEADGGADRCASWAAAGSAERQSAKQSPSQHDARMLIRGDGWIRNRIDAVAGSCGEHRLPNARASSGPRSALPIPLGGRRHANVFGPRKTSVALKNTLGTRGEERPPHRGRSIRRRGRDLSGQSCQGDWALTTGAVGFPTGASPPTSGTRGKRERSGFRASRIGGGPGEADRFCGGLSLLSGSLLFQPCTFSSVPTSSLTRPSHPARTMGVASTKARNATGGLTGTEVEEKRVSADSWVI